MKAAHDVEDLRFAFHSNTAQGFAPRQPNPGAPISLLHALDGGPNAYELFGSNSFAFEAGAGGHPAINNFRTHSERQRSASPRTYSSPYGNPELEYVYLGSPKALSPFLTPGFSFNASHAVQPAEELQFLDQHALLTETDYRTAAQEVRFADSPFDPGAESRFDETEPKAQVEQFLMAPASDPDLQHDGVWANLEAVLLGQESAPQFDIPPIDHIAVNELDRANQPHVDPSSARNDHGTSWDVLSNVAQAVPAQDHHHAEGASSSSNNFTTDTGGKAPRSADHVYTAEVGQSSNHGFRLLSEIHGNSLTDLVGMLMEQPGAASREDSPPSPQHEVIYTRIPDGHLIQSDAPPPSEYIASGQRFALPENDSRDAQQQVGGEQRGAGGGFDAQQQQSSQHQAQGAYNVPVMDNDFLQLLSGVGRLGEPCWALQLLNLCAEAIASQNISRTQHLMWVLNDLASAHGDVNQRFAAYGLKALFCRITDNTEAVATFARPRHNEQEISFGSDRVHRALVRFHDYVPWHQMCYTASCQTLLEVCAGKGRLHLIDIGAGKGIEWPIFIDALVSRTGGPPSILRITMIRDLRREEHNLRYAKSVNSEAADFMTRLVKFASVLGLHVEVNMVTKALECVTREDLRLRHGEILAVVCQFRLHRLVEEVPELGSSGHMLPSRPPLSPRDEFMDFVYKLNPHVFILSDNNSDHSSPDFLTRFRSACNYWWHFYESLDMGYNGKHAEERQIIEFEAGTVMLNQVACEGIARIERNETYPVWARRVKHAGFVPKDLSADTKAACQTLVQNHSEFWDLNFDEPNVVNLRWRKLDTTFTSVWTTPAGSCSKPSCKCSMLHK